jgi:uncharacterized protein
MKYLTGLFIVSILLAGCTETIDTSIVEKQTDRVSTAHSGTACFDNGNCVQLELAQTAEARRLGLMYRSAMPHNVGMLFVFPQQGKHGFWMKNTPLPLDIIWMNENQEIVEIVANAQPCPKEGNCHIWTPRAEALWVLEVNAGLVKENNVELSQSIALHYGS